MIKVTALLIASLAFAASSSWADQFQVRASNGEILRHTAVLVKDTSGRTLATRYTDRLGRFEFRRRGSYRIEVSNRRADITVSNDRNLKRITLQ